MKHLLLKLLLSSQIDASVVGIDSLENLHVFTMGEDINLENTIISAKVNWYVTSNAEWVRLSTFPRAEYCLEKSLNRQYGDQITCLEIR